ncbi:O-methyltransferase [Paenibacillus pasadenensis]|uniref:O-methyltransferase n=1 Tax=Paenibacillus pasadenensis TaxID=217090 RepID=UPI00203EACF1|nr:O-methyltransferase [Paenibacillus pasadenensis]MCM3748249.1 O-methyltransferase [Paenibacillus pasadenensis]
MTSSSYSPLARQVDFVFRQLEPELTHAPAGTVLIHIRNNTVGKYGIRHNPIELKSSSPSPKGLSADQVKEFRQMAVDALKHKSNWTHGEILYDFSVRQGSASSWSASMACESNYNMASSHFRYEPKHPSIWDRTVSEE